MMKPVEDLSDKELVDEFVRFAKKARPKLSQQAAGRVVGVGQTTASEWYRGTVREIRSPHTRAALEDAVRQARETGKLPTTIAIVTDASANGDLDFWIRYDAIADSELPEPWKIYRLDAMTAALRQYTQAKDATAAVARTRLMAFDARLQAERRGDLRSEWGETPKPPPRDSSEAAEGEGGETASDGGDPAP